MNNMTNDRIEIAILQKPVNKYNPGTAPFTIPALSYNTTDNKISSTVTLQNKTDKTSSIKINISKTIDLQIPIYCTRHYTDRYVPTNTKFIVAFIGGDINNIRIIGMY